MDGTVLDTWYPSPTLIQSTRDVVSGTQRLGAADLPQEYLQLVGLDEGRLVEMVGVKTVIADLDAHPIDAHDVYLRLHLLSHRLVKPLEINLDNALQHLATVAWANKGPMLPVNFEALRTGLRSRGAIHVYGIDQIPRMVDYVVPTGVHIAEAQRVRLGAYLAEGTRVVREGYVSHNSGSLGPAVIEGRLTSSTVIGAGTDVGPSASILADERHAGLRSPIRVGDNCVLAVGSGLAGVDMGNNCSLGPNIVLDPDTALFDVVFNQLTTAGNISGRSDWHVRHAAEHDTPVVYWEAPGDRWAR